MNLLEEVEAICRSINYKREFRLQCDWYGDSIKVMILIPVDRMDKEERGTIVSFALINPHHDATDVVHIIHSTILELEIHEMNEWFTVDGEFLHNPHPELKDHRPMAKYPLPIERYMPKRFAARW